MRFECCLDARGEPQYARSTQGHSGVSDVDPNFVTLLEIPNDWETHINHTGSLNNYRSIVQGRLIAGGTSDRRRRQIMLLLSDATVG